MRQLRIYLVSDVIGYRVFGSFVLLEYSESNVVRKGSGDEVSQDERESCADRRTSPDGEVAARTSASAS
jgi:hypothetical protein